MDRFVKCPSCGYRVRVSDNPLKKAAACTACGEPLSLPHASAVEDVQAPPPASPKKSDEPGFLKRILAHPSGASEGGLAGAIAGIAVAVVGGIFVGVYEEKLTGEIVATIVFGFVIGFSIGTL